MYKYILILVYNLNFHNKISFLNLDPILLAGDVQGREAVEGAAVGVGLAVEQQLCHAHVAAVCSHVQGGQVVYRHLGRTRDAETRGKQVSHKF